MCSRHVEGGGSINGGASLFGLPLPYPPLASANFISHNRASKPRRFSPLSSFIYMCVCVCVCVCVCGSLRLPSVFSPTLFLVRSTYARRVRSFSLNLLVYPCQTQTKGGGRARFSFARAVSIGVRSLSSTSAKPFKTLFNSGEQL